MDEHYDYYQHSHFLTFVTYRRHKTSSIAIYLHEIAFHEDKAYTNCIINSLSGENPGYEML
jgi:Zn-dependent membrane protease YugP